MCLSQVLLPSWSFTLDCSPTFCSTFSCCFVDKLGCFDAWEIVLAWSNRVLDKESSFFSVEKHFLFTHVCCSGGELGSFSTGEKDLEFFKRVLDSESSFLSVEKDLLFCFELWTLLRASRKSFEDGFDCIEEKLLVTGTLGKELVPPVMAPGCVLDGSGEEQASTMDFSVPEMVN